MNLRTLNGLQVDLVRRGKRFSFCFVLLLCFVAGGNILQAASDDGFGIVEQKPVIEKVIVEGNKYIKTDAILRGLPYREGQQFDKDRTADAIASLYALGFFRQVQIEQEKLDDNKINLYVVVEERKLLEGIAIEGNRAIKTKKIMGDLKLDKLETVDEEQIKSIARKIKKLYRDENYHMVKVLYKIVVNKAMPDKAKVIFTIDEGKKARIKRIFFKGNKHIPSRKLRTIIFTREDWILGLLDDSGKYEEDALEMDKKRVEYYYRNYGYLMAKVAGVDVEFVNHDKEINVTFHIREGDQFFIRYISAPGDDLFHEDELLEHVLIESGEPFSQEKLVKSIEKLKEQWGEIGYIYADVYPQVVPNEETHEVDVTFHAEKGKRMFVNRINITGNKITKDRVIRRELEIEEGDLITSKKLGNSQTNVEYLGFFDRGAVNWQMHKIDEDNVDLELNLKEAKTGKFNAALSYGSDKGSTKRSLRGSLSLEKSNFLGRGFDVGANVQSSIHRFQSGSVHFYDPHLFDTDISYGLNLYVRHEEYDQWKNLSPTPIERVYGASTSVGFLLPKFSRRTRVGLDLGYERIHNNNPQTLPVDRLLLQPIVNRTFQEGDHLWFGANIVKDIRNHRVYPSKGYKILFGLKTAPPGVNDEFSYIKAELDWSWYTPLIGEQDLVLMLHARAGIVDHIVCDKVIPYKELFHMGGQNTVRGFVWGSIGPAWVNGNPLGGRKAFQFNTELIFPLVPDYRMKGHVFYDAGAGWDTPKQCIDNSAHIRRDKFNLRHAVGFGINLSNPFPAKIDWGYKLDRDKAAGESPHEFHISMNTAW